MGVIGGLLEFGIVYQVAFSEASSPAPEVPGNSETDKEPAGPVRRVSDGHAAGQTELDAEPAATPSPSTNAASSPPPPPSGPQAAAGPAADRPAASRTSGTASTEAPLTDTLLAAANSIVGGIAAVPAAIAPLPADSAPPADANPLTQVLPQPGPPPAPPAPQPIDLARLPVEDMIRRVFGPEGEKAVQVARCESTLRTQAKRGQFMGLFQMGENERAEYGHGADALAQVKAAHALFLDRGWQPWTCA